MKYIVYFIVLLSYIQIEILKNIAKLLKICYHIYYESVLLGITSHISKLKVQNRASQIVVVERLRLNKIVVAGQLQLK